MTRKALFLLLQALLMLCGTAKAALTDVVTYNAVGATVSFTSSGSYEWEWDSQKQKMRSTNYHVNSSTSQTTITISTSSPCIFSFDYAVSSESNYDKLTIILDGNTIVNAISGTTSSSYSSTLSSGSHTLVLKYVKDGSDYSNDDRAYVSNMKFLEFDSTEIPVGIIQSGSCGEDLSYVLNVDGTLVITGSGKMFDYYGSSTAAPWFTKRDEIKKVQIEYGIESIGDYAFYQCSALIFVTIPNSVTSIGNGAFNSCSNLPSISIPNSVMSVGDYAFSGCEKLPVIDSIRYADTYLAEATNKNKLTSVNIKEGTKWISGSAFENCYYLTSVTIPNSVTRIGYGAFEDCSRLTSIIIPNNVTSIGKYAFSECLSLTSVAIPNSVSSIGDYAFNRCTGLTTVSIGGNLQVVEPYTFSNCSNIKELIYAEGCTTAIRTFLTSVKKVVIPNSVTSIGENAFYGCSGLTSVNIPNSVTNIGGGAFSGCSGLTSVNIPNSVTNIEDAAFYDCFGLTNITIPNSVTTIGNYAFANCSALTSVTIPNGVKYIGSNAFESCSALTSVTIPNSVIGIGSKVFSGCSALTSVTIPNSVTNIYFQTFENCSALTSVTIPNSVTKIESSVFSGCSVLKEVYCYIEEPRIGLIGSYTFSGCNISEATLYVPRKSVESYKKAYYWKDFGTILPIPIPAETITIICNEMENSVISLNVGSTCTLTATLTPSDATDEVTWSSSNTDIATISEVGVVTAIAVGKTIITAKTSNGKSALCEVTITNPNTEESLESDTDISDIANTIYLDNCEAFCGKTIEVPIKMKNDIAATGFQFDIILPEGITAVQDEDGFYDITLSTERTTAAKTNTFDSSLMSDGSIRVLAASTRNYAFSGNDGEVCKIKLKVSEDLPAGDYPIILKNIELTNAQGQTWNVERLKRTLTIVDYIIGDANGDTRVSVGDFSAIASHIMGDTPEGFIVMAADVNGDTRVSVGDLSAVVPLIMSDTETHDLAKGMKAKRRGNVAETDISDLDNVIYADAVTIVPGQDSEIVLNMKNSIAATGFQFDVYLPVGISVPEVEEGIYDASLSTIRTTTAKTNTFECGLMNDGSYRVLAASTRNAVFEGNDGEVVRIRLHAEEELAEGSYPIYLRNIELTNAQGQTYNTNELVSQLTVENGASIYAEGYALDITPFEFNEDVEIPILFDNADDITNIEFDLMLPQAFIDSELYYVDAKLAKTKFTTNIGDINGGVHVAIARRSSNKVAAGEDTEVSVLGLIFEDVAEGLYTVEAKNITATTTDGDEVKVAPYKASVLVGNPSLAGEVTLYGKYTSAENAIIEYVIANDDANVTVENVILSDDECFNTANEFVAEHVAYDAEVSASLGYKTLVLPYDCAVPVGFEAYEVGSVTGNTLNMEPVNTITANKPVILKNAGTARMEAMNVTINATNGETYTDGVLVGTYKTINAPVGSYVLQNQEGNVAFYCVGETVQPVVNPFRAYLELTSMKAKVVNLNFGDEVSSINLETGMSVDGDIYNANGVRTAKMHRGVNIVRTGKGVMKVLN